MKAYQATASSSVKSSTTAAAMDERDSCYYPGCRKDTNCNCDICLASINATLDLMPVSIQKSSLTKFSSSCPNVEGTPVYFNPSILSTPLSDSCPKMESPLLKSIARLNLSDKKEKRKRVRGFLSSFSRLLLGLSLLFVAEIGFSWGPCGVLSPILSPDIVRNIGKRSQVGKDLRERLRFIQNELKGFVTDGKVSNCSHISSIWKINQEGLLLNSQCELYKSAMEEVSIWGWPWQTAGLLKIGFSTRSFTVLSGGVTEWSNGMIGYSTIKANSSWVHRKWGASVVQLDPSTWVLEYRRSSILDCTRLSSAVAELFMYQMSKVMRKINRDFWFFSALEDRYSEYTAGDYIKIPT
ncbi:hypothetical protein P3X46_027647 [Hevea brasiliensis]|uniref:ERG2/sigma1 receptor-like protein n=1 Tax=Hevea brasiliensis TaxID=3981 RepID=A0ABQ9L1L3_HEVBR|nr:uncharacterized protein LOC110671068 [Hevea brasiliensis]KAJ9154294.1 hypothetical protein P3X46_027647 [Hevea brasiliensis]